MRIFKKLLSAASLFLFSASAYSQAPVYESAFTIAGAQNDFTELIETDPSGNTYVTGRFGAGCDFDPGPVLATMPVTNGLADLFIAKYTASGVLVWKYSLGAAFEFMRSFKMDPAGNLYIVGDYSGVLTINSAGAPVNLPLSNGTDAFVAKFDPSGQLLFAINLSGTSTEYIQDIAFDQNGDFYIGGEFTSLTLDFDPSAGTSTLTKTTTNTAIYEPYLAKYSSSGAFIWCRGFQNADSDFTRGLAVDDNGRVIISGYYDNMLTVDSASNTNLVGIGSSIDCFIARYNSNGSYDNSWSIGGPNIDQLVGMATYHNKIYLTGTFGTSMDLDPGVNTYIVNTNAQTDVFLAVLDSSGAFTWGGSFGGGGTDYVESIKIDSLGDVYLTGSFLDSIDFDLGPQFNIAFGAHGDRDGFVVKYSNTGSYLYSLQQASVAQDITRDITMTQFGFRICGTFVNNPMYLNPQNPLMALPNAGTNDGYIANFVECSSPVINAQPLSAGSCLGGTVNFSINGTGQNLTYQWQEGTNGGTVWTNLTNGGLYSGVTTTTLTVAGVSSAQNNNFYRCILSADCGLSTTSGVGILFIGTINNSVTASSGSLTANQSFALYQWLDCNNGSVPVPGANSQTFNPAVNGSYAAEINLGGCLDTTLCYTITTAGINSISNDEIRIYPVPAGNELHLELTEMSSYTAKIFDVTGRFVLGNAIHFDQSIILNTSWLETGTYLLQVQKMNGDPTYLRFIKQ